jgi:hypothetical protein
MLSCSYFSFLENGKKSFILYVFHFAFLITSSLGSYTTMNRFSHWFSSTRIGSLLAYMASKGCRWGCGATQGFWHVVSLSVEVVLIGWADVPYLAGPFDVSASGTDLAPIPLHSTSVHLQNCSVNIIFNVTVHV